MPLAEAPGVLPEAFPELFARRQDRKRFDRRRDDRGCHGVREEIGPAPLAKQRDDLAPAGSEPARRAAERLAERRGHDVHPVGHGEAFGCSAAGRAVETGGVRVIHHQERAMPVGESRDLIERCHRPVHAEDTIGRDQLAPRSRTLLELPGEIFHVPVPVAESPGPTEPHPVDDARVVQFVAQNGILRAEQGLEEAAVRIEARAVEDGVLRPEGKAATPRSSSRWMSWVPQMKRTELSPKPRSSSPRRAAATMRGSLPSPR